MPNLISCPPRSLFYCWSPEALEWAIEHFPELRSPITAPSVARKKFNQSPLSELLVPLCSGPGHDLKRLEYAKKMLKLVEDGGPHHYCGLAKDAQKNSPAFYASAAQRAQLLYCVLDYEKKSDW